VLLAVVVLTKRDGYLLAAVVILAALAVSRGRARSAWPRIGAMAATTVALALPWRIFLSVRGLDSGTPPGGMTGFLHHFDRGWPALRLTLTTLVDYDVWLVLTPIAVLAIAVAFVGGGRALPTYAALVYVLAALGFTWVSWSYTNIAITENPAINPIIRLTGSLALFAAALVPLLLETAWCGEEGRG
jgi:multisubunit Na+/H+ antiporter MnhB subunit